MQQVCPLCNGLVRLRLTCDRCSGDMEDQGMMQDYFGPYSPYMDRESFTYDNKALIMGDNLCVHLFYCPNCEGWQHRTVAPMFF